MSHQDCLKNAVVDINLNMLKKEDLTKNFIESRPKLTDEKREEKAKGKGTVNLSPPKNEKY